MTFSPALGPLFTGMGVSDQGHLKAASVEWQLLKKFYRKMRVTELQFSVHRKVGILNPFLAVDSSHSLLENRKDSTWQTIPMLGFY